MSMVLVHRLLLSQACTSTRACHSDWLKRAKQNTLYNVISQILPILKRDLKPHHVLLLFYQCRNIHCNRIMVTHLFLLPLLSVIFTQWVACHILQPCCWAVQFMAHILTNQATAVCIMSPGVKIYCMTLEVPPLTGKEFMLHLKPLLNSEYFYPIAA